MDKQIAIGAALTCSNPIINATASAIGIAKTGTAIGTLHGAAHTSATAAWIGFGSMKVGMLMMNAFPIVGGLLLLDAICGRDPGAPIIDWYEEAWKRYEAQCELEELKKTIKVDPDHQVRSKQAGSLEQLNNQFRALEVEHELYLLKKTVKTDPDHQVRAKQAASLQQLNSQFQALEVENELYLLKKELGLL